MYGFVVKTDSNQSLKKIGDRIIISLYEERNFFHQQLYGKRLSEEHFKKAIELLKDESKLYKIPIEQIMEKKGVKINSIPRQLLGQPASPGLACILATAFFF